jgi:PAS domain-containing protein
LVDLRLKAAVRLNGYAETGRVAAKAANALAVLHTLASSPDTAADALALLHELQVHQVELDLQAEELRDSRVDLEGALRRQIEMFDFLPVGCFCVDDELVIRETNLRGAALLGVDRQTAFGLGLDTFLSAESTQALRRLMAHGAAANRSTCAIVWRKPAEGDLALSAEVGPDPSGGFFVVITPLAPVLESNGA